MSARVDSVSTEIVDGPASGSGPIRTEAAIGDDDAPPLDQSAERPCLSRESFHSVPPESRPSFGPAIVVAPTGIVPLVVLNEEEPAEDRPLSDSLRPIVSIPPSMSMPPPRPRLAWATTAIVVALALAATIVLSTRVRASRAASSVAPPDVTNLDTLAPFAPPLPAASVSVHPPVAQP